MLDPDLIHEINTNRFKVSSVNQLLSDFDKINMPSFMQYMQLIERIKTAMEYSND